MKLPLCESLVVNRRDKLWTSREWTYPDIDQRAIYIATMWAYDMAARVSEYTAAEGSAEDHCVRAGDLLFGFTSFTARGGDEYFRRVTEGITESCTAIGCWVRPSTNKTGEAVATKLIGRRHAGESQHLDDLIEWVTKSQVKPEDELFSRYAIVRGRLSLKRMRPRAIRESVKAICEEAELNPRHFSSHSIRKAALSHMRALGESLEDRQERGGYSGDSALPNTTYNYSTAGHGALSSNSIAGEIAPDVDNIRRYLPGRGDDSRRTGGSVSR